MIASQPGTRAEGVRARLDSKTIAIRLFFTCWIIFTLHFATNTVREIYLTLAIADNFSFRVDEYANMHPDLFEKPGYGWHIGANPGASMIAAIPYALCRPVIDRIVDKVNATRKAQNAEPPPYDSPWPMAREFHRESFRRGYDIKFGLASLVTQGLCMAPISALGVVAMFWLLRRLLQKDGWALGLSLLYAFGTPVFFRTGFLNHNLMLGHFAFIGFVLLWNPDGLSRLGVAARWFIAGITGGAALLFDYSGVVLLLSLFAYALVKSWTDRGISSTVRDGLYYIAGSVPPVLLLWLYQWRSFGDPFRPGQHWMPPVEWIGQGYQGFGLPQWELIASLAVDYRYGLFTTCPLFIFGLAAPFLNRGRNRLLPRTELLFLVGSITAFWLFCAGINYTRLQFNTGLRYLAPILPFFFVLTSAVLVRMPRMAVNLIAVAAVAQGWSLAMYRDVERGLGVLDPLVRVALGGFQLPSLTVIGRMGGQFREYFPNGISPLFVFGVIAAIIFCVWYSEVDDAGKLKERRHNYSSPE